MPATLAMPATSEPASLSEMIETAQATATAAATAATTIPPAAQIPAAAPAAPTAADTAATATPPDDGTATTTTDDGTATQVDATATTDGTATDTTTTDGAAAADATPPAAIDWGAAMPALAAKAQQLLGEEAGVLTKYNNIDDLLRSIAEREKQVGAQSAYVGAFNQLAQHGVTTRELQALRDGDLNTLNALLAARLGTQPVAAAPAPPTNGQPQLAWSKKFLSGRNADGTPIFNRAELARAGWTEAQATQAFAGWQEQAADLWSGPEAIEEYIAKIVDSRVGQATQQTEQKLTAAQQQALYQAQQQAQAQAAQKAEADAAMAWGQSNAKLLYVNGKDVSSGATKFFQDMQAFINSGAVNPNLPHAQQLEVAKNYVLAVNRTPAPPPATPSEKAKRQPATGAQAVKLTPEQFHEKFKDRYADQSRDATGLAEWIMYEATGKVPDKR